MLVKKLEDCTNENLQLKRKLRGQEAAPVPAPAAPSKAEGK
jgi:hypothetical protein